MVKKKGMAFVCVCMIALALTLVPGPGVKVNGAQRWLGLDPCVYSHQNLQRLVWW